MKPPRYYLKPDPKFRPGGYMWVVQKPRTLVECYGGQPPEAPLLVGPCGPDEAFATLDWLGTNARP